MASPNSPVAPTLQGKVAIVTCASRGIGAGLALELARRGAKVSRAYHHNLTRDAHIATGHAGLYVSQK
jgi:NAD(P)-dependent dehydrogenase (short-subunit alcohol dehydrogenase family)